MASNLWILAIILLFLNLLRTRYSRGLNKFNGPFLASFTNLWKVWYAFNSSQEPTYVDIHRKYGDIVRIGPNALSFADPQAIHDIYGPKGTPRKVQILIHRSGDCLSLQQISWRWTLMLQHFTVGDVSHYIDAWGGCLH
jgi:hypothetical protein